MVALDLWQGAEFPHDNIIQRRTHFISGSQKELQEEDGDIFQTGMPRNPDIQLLYKQCTLSMLGVQEAPRLKWKLLRLSVGFENIGYGGGV